MDKVLFSHKSDHWATPHDIYHAFVEVLGCFDPCPLHSDFDGLSIDWKDHNFVNPPYSDISSWVDKAIIEFGKGHGSTLLIPARTDTKYFRKLFDFSCDFFFITGRLKFGDSKNSAPFPSVLVILKGFGRSTMRYWE